MANAPTLRKQPDPQPNPQRQQANRKLALVLASVAVVFFVGFVGKIVVFGR